MGSSLPPYLSAPTVDPYWRGRTLPLCFGFGTTSKATKEQIMAFWTQLSSALGCLPRSCNVVFCIDANAKFAQHEGEPDTLHSQAPCLNSELLTRLCFEHGLTVSKQFSVTGARLHSWTSPTGNKSLVDYIVVPSSWGDVFDTLDSPQLGDLHSGLDHKPHLARCRPVLEGARTTPGRNPNWKALDSPEGRLALQRAWTTMPTTAWDVDATSHVAQMHQHLRDSILRDLPAAQGRPRNPVLTERTLVSASETVRTCHSSDSDAGVLVSLLSVVTGQGTQAAPPSPHAVRRAGRICRSWFGRVLKANGQVQAAIARDRADFSIK